MVLNNNIGEMNGYLGKYSYEKDGTKSFEPKCRSVKLVRRIKVIETGEHKNLLEWEDNGSKHRIEVNRKDLVKSKAGYLLSKGLDFYEHSATIMIKYIQQQEEFVGLILRHEGLGWTVYNNELVFRGNRLITSKNSSLKSKYCGEIAIQPKGDVDIYKQMLKEEVIGYIPSETAFVMGASSVVHSYLGKENNYETLFFNLFNDSSKGKSIAELLAVSTSSKPSIQGNTNVTTWLSTPNYIAACLRNNYGMCFAIDEGSFIKGDISDVVYMLVGGEERGRQKPNLKIQNSGNWNTTIISTSEGSLMELVNQNEGIPNRLFEFGYVTWTKSAESANRIKRCIQDNYGFLVYDLADYLVNQDYEQVRCEFMQEVKSYEDAIGKENHNEFTPRVAMKMGILLYTTELVNRVWDIGLDKKGILNFIIENLHNNQSQDIADRAYDCILEQVTKHNHRFCKKINGVSMKLNADIVPKGEIWGRIRNKYRLVKDNNKRKTRKKKEYWYREIIFLPHILEELLQDNGFTNVSVVLKKLKEKGLLNGEGGKNIRRSIILSGEGEVSTYVIVDRRTPCEIEDEETANDVEHVDEIFDEEEVA